MNVSMLNVLADTAAGVGNRVWLPKGVSTFAPSTDGLWYFIYYLCVVFFIGIVGAMVYFGVKYKKRGDDDKTHPIKGHHKLEIIWSAVPGVLLIAVFAWGFVGYMNALVPPSNAIEINVSGQKWSWTFIYDNGGSGPELVVPVNEPVVLTMSSVDVLHSFYIPAFRVKRDVLPNRYTQIWFEATQEGSWPIFCTEYCGTNHSLMLSTVRVVSQEEYEEYLGTLTGCQDDQTLEECGEGVFANAGCAACHSVDGSPLIGPTLAGVFGREEQMTDGTTVTVDENYLRESIVDPGAQIVAGFDPVMPTFSGLIDDEQMIALIEYLKSLPE